MPPASLFHSPEADVILIYQDTSSVPSPVIYRSASNEGAISALCNHAHAMQIYTDAALAKINFRWRTALIVRPSRLLPACRSPLEPA